MSRVLILLSCLLALLMQSAQAVHQACVMPSDPVASQHGDGMPCDGPPQSVAGQQWLQQKPCTDACHCPLTGLPALASTLLPLPQPSAATETLFQPDPPSHISSVPHPPPIA